MAQSFVPVRGFRDKIDSMGFADGHVYFAVDTGEILMDYVDPKTSEHIRAKLGDGSGSSGGGNSGIFYAKRPVTPEEKLESEIIFSLSDIEGGEYPEIDDLIINSEDSCFYRVIKISRMDRSITGRRLTISGGSGGDGSKEDTIKLSIEELPTKNFINGQEQKVYFTATSALDRKGNPIDSTITVSWSLAYKEGENNFITYKTDMVQVKSGERSSIEFGKYARNSSTSQMTMTVSQMNSSSTYTNSFTFTMSELSLSIPNGHDNLSYYPPKSYSIDCNISGSVEKIIEYYFDDAETPIKTSTLPSNKTSDSVTPFSIVPERMTNGAHEVWVRLYQAVDSGTGEKVKGLEVTPLHYEVAIYDGDINANPIIWLGEYKEEYYNYDTIQIPFRVFDPLDDTPEVHFKRNNIELPYSPQEITDSKSFALFEISNPEVDIVNHYSITCGENERETIRRIEIKVVQDPNRLDFGIQKQNYLTYSMNTVGSGRSNSETLSKRTTLVNAADDSNPCPAVFKGFNWYNNGWQTDESTSKTMLRISNGASLSIPVGKMMFANSDGNAATDTSHTIELNFKIRNVQDYSTLIHTITRYVGDTDLYKMFYDTATGEYLTDFTNYDAFLADYLQNHKWKPEGSSESTPYYEYDDLEFERIEKQINLNNVVLGYYSGDTKAVTGLCLGPQDAFFSNGNNTVSVSYLEDQIITLSVVYKYSSDSTQNLIQIYLNGVLTGVVSNTKGAFLIDNDNLVINSNTCDIDLYKIRMYRTDLNVNDIVMNYAADLEDVHIYDQNKLAEENSSINEYLFKYNNMINYNLEHPDEPLMPYVIFDTYKFDSDKLPSAKSKKRQAGFEFVNTMLDAYYTNGKLEELAKADGLWKDGATPEQKIAAVKNYYEHHCPSFIAPVVDLSVQGTSSEFYPRRNYKVKTKTQLDKNDTKRVQIFLNRGPFKEEYEKDAYGTSQDPFILSTTSWVINGETYYSDSEGKNQVTFTEDMPYEKNKYYIKNKDYIEKGNESSHRDWWYFNNYTCGTTKFTMKIDFMESSGTYNMGFANMVSNGYMNHPLEDYNKAKAFTTKSSTYEEATEYNPKTKYYYYNHNDKIKAADGEDGDLIINSAEDLAKGPVALWDEQQAGATTKKVCSKTGDVHYNKFYTSEDVYTDDKVKNTDDYRTSVRGFRVLAFHKRTDPYGGSDPYYQFIGMYNMLLDKGSDEVYGFVPAEDVYAKYIGKGNKKVKKIAECWEFENNSRTFCSYRDPQNRKDLRFDVFDENGDRVVNATQSAPIVADSFEYRYHDDADILDYIMTGTGSLDDADADLAFNRDNIKENQDNRAKRLLGDYANWEKAVAWVWSTCVDSVVSQGTYEPVSVGDDTFDPKVHYIAVDNPDYDPNNPESPSKIYQLATEYVEGETYYRQYTEDGVTKYKVAHFGDYLFDDVRDELYYSVASKKKTSYVACNKSDSFNDSTEYFFLKTYSDDELDEIADRLVEVCNDEAFDENQTYYTYDGDKHPGEAVTKVTITADDYEPGKYYIGKTVTYNKRSYKYDTIEYRGDKFVNELDQHFNKEYMATYFVMTEVFECYDSRGKNCMMASWGPQKAGGEYIWYPIFYDIDTQLGINNTGIPSFEYNVDATEDGNFSTSDSVLWNNFYTYFKTALIIPKYEHLRGTTTSVFGGNLANPPLVTVNAIEQQYLTNYNVTKNIADLGTRPLVAVNLDEYYKYITITNGASVSNGLTGHLGLDENGVYERDDGGFFYALQGNRSLSRQQFLTNRLDYIDSWLNEGSYRRAGSNSIAGRIAANNATRTSDRWVETADDPYFNSASDEKAYKKRHLFDGEYWVTLTPTHSSYVTLGDDNEAYPSQKYDGIHPLKFEVNSIKQGVRTSANYPEQLLYIYGIHQISDLGDMSNLYWQEFKISGDASKMTTLKLGYDGRWIDPDGKSGENGERWYNNNVNTFIIPAAKPASDAEKGMPLLKEMNMSNIQFNAASPELNLTSCEKLRNFRATGSNLVQVKFAEGVALDTCYLPASITNLSLVEANRLENIITTDEYKIPERNSEGNLVAAPGLYIEGFFDKNGDNSGVTNITDLKIAGGILGYDSYKLLKQYYKLRSKQNTTSNISLTNVNWSPYVLVTEDDSQDANELYYVDNGHYCFDEFTGTYDEWLSHVVNGELYRKDTSISNDDINLITDIEMLKDFITNPKYVKNLTVKIPEITGTIFINNTESIKESELRNTISKNYPNLKVFCANVEQGYTARFVIMDNDEGETGKYTLLGSMTLGEGETWFRNPIDEWGDVSKYKPNHDFYGWALTNSINADILVNIDKSIDKWDTQTLDSDKHTYIFYAICPIHKWSVKYYYKDGTLFEEKFIPNGNPAELSDGIPWMDDSELDLEKTYQFLGYNRSAQATKPMVLSDYLITEDTNFYAIFNSEPISVYDNIHPEYFGVSTQTVDVGDRSWRETDNSNSQYNISKGVSLALQKRVKGKLTVPAYFEVNGEKLPVISIDATFSSPGSLSSDPAKYTGTAKLDGIGQVIVPICCGQDLTHVFFEKIDDDGNSNIRVLQPYAFSNSYQLKYVEFPKGLRYIGTQCFFNYSDSSRNYSPSFINNKINGTIESVGRMAFSNAFAPSVEILEIGPSVKYLGGRVSSTNVAIDLSIYYRGYSQHYVKTVKVGSREAPSKLVMSDGTTLVNGYTYNNNVPTDTSVEIYCSYSGQIPTGKGVDSEGNEVTKTLEASIFANFNQITVNNN